MCVTTVHVFDFTFVLFLDCDSTPETDLRHLCCLVKGALYGRLKNDEKAIQV